ncbi:hypothetical protein VNO77_43194 [Canavalia gladiata]|uniref:Uncharacterized protein n=1 Tax=Canavalia gladiata TaxID=3824 RepID=A0AAN9JVV8_CANGL
MDVSLKHKETNKNDNEKCGQTKNMNVVGVGDEEKEANGVVDKQKEDVGGDHKKNNNRTTRIVDSISKSIVNGIITQDFTKVGTKDVHHDKIQEVVGGGVEGLGHDRLKGGHDRHHR